MRIAQKKAQLEQSIELERLALKQRRQEYNKSMTKHAEYPCIPEFQNKFRDRHTRELAALEEAHSAAVAEFDRTTDQLATSLAQALPVDIEAIIHRELQGQIQNNTGVNEARIKALETSLEARIASLDKSLEQKIGYVKNEVKQAHNNHRELKANLEREKREDEDRLASVIEKKLALQFEQKMTAQQEVIDRLLDSHRRLAEELSSVQNETRTAPTSSSHSHQADFKAQVERLEAQQNCYQESHQEQARSHRADLTKITIECGRLRDDVEYLREEVARRSELAAMKTDYNHVKAENANLSALLSQIRDDNKDLSTRFGEYAEMTREHQVTVSRLDAVSQEHQTGLSRLDMTTEKHGDELSRLDMVTRGHQDELSRLDLTVLEQVAEGWGIEWPNVVSSVQAFTGVVGRVEKLEQSYPDVVRLRDRLEHFERDGQSVPQPAAEAEDRVGCRNPVVSGDGVSLQDSVGSGDEVENRPAGFRDLSSRVLTVEQEVSAYEERVSRVEAFTKDALVKFGQVLDNVTRRVKTTEARLDELPVSVSASSSQDADAETRSKVDNVLGEVEKASIELEAMDSRLEAVRGQVKRLESQVEGIPQQVPANSFLHSDPEVSKFKTKVEKFEGDFEKLSTEMQGVSAGFEYLNHQVTILDSQYNSITTKALAEHILAHMELVYPTNHEIIANMQELQRRMNGVEHEARNADEQSRKARETLDELRQRVNLAIGQHAATGQPPNKRRRIEDGMNGNPRPSPNGADTSADSPAGRERD